MPGAVTRIVLSRESHRLASWLIFDVGLRWAKMKVTFAAAFLLLALPARSALQFAGFMSLDGTLRFVVTEGIGGRTSGWLSVGESFAGHTVVAYDDKLETLILKSQRGEVRLPLNAARIKPGESSPSRMAMAREQQSGLNTVFMTITANGTIHDIDAVKKRLAALRPDIKEAVYSHMQLPDNAPVNPREYHAFLLPAMLSFEEVCTELGLKHAGGSIKPPKSAGG